MTALTYLLGKATAAHHRARTPSFVVAPDVWDRLVQEAPEQMREAAPPDGPDVIELYTPGGRVVVRKSKRVHPGCVETWEQWNTTRIP